MTAPCRAILLGLAAAAASPYWLTADRMTLLICCCSRTGGSRPEAAPAMRSIRVAMFALRLLARVPGGLWKNTCLYRAVTQCVVLRHYGFRCRVQIGVRRTGNASQDTVSAHAWVALEQRVTEPWIPLRSTSAC
ncbi:hypothetical protein HRbin33_02030 [bacterium HR33]|nr:hypothetical protein HRbin33_02030 [bacterium HR33]